MAGKRRSSSRRRSKKITKAQRRRCRQRHPGWTVRINKRTGKPKCMRPRSR